MRMSPIDLGCTTLVPVRSTRLAMIATFAYAGHGTLRIEEKSFPACTVHATTGGSWTLHGRKARSTIDRGTVILGMADERYGCAHDSRHANEGIVAVLLSDALDGDVPDLFDRQVLHAPEIPTMLSKTSASLTDDEFDSRVFEVFHTLSKRSLERGQSRSNLRMQRAKRFIEQHAREPIGIREIADAVGINPFVCVRQFKDATGTTPYAYVMQCRMREAKRLLRETHQTVDEVALRTGFKDTAHFCRFFKRSAGLTPTQYRIAS